MGRKPKAEVDEHPGHDFIMGVVYSRKGKYYIAINETEVTTYRPKAQRWDVLRPHGRRKHFTVQREMSFAELAKVLQCSKEELNKKSSEIFYSPEEPESARISRRKGQRRHLKERRRLGDEEASGRLVKIRRRGKDQRWILS